MQSHCDNALWHCAQATLYRVPYTNAATLIVRSESTDINGVSLRVLFVLAGLCIVLLSNMYQGLLLSSLLLDNESMPFESLRGAANAIASGSLFELL